MILAVARGQGRSIVAEPTRREPLKTTGPALLSPLIAQFPHYNGYPDDNCPLQPQRPFTRLPRSGKDN